MGSRLGVFVVLGLVAFGAAIVILAQPVDAPYVDAGVEAPPFDLPRLGVDESLALEGLRGRVVLVNFWATWCKPCEDEMPSMQRLYKALEGERFELVAISVDDGSAELKAFQERLGLTFPILLDPDRKAARVYQSNKYPETYLIDAEGVRVARYVGPREWDAPEYEARIRRLLAGEKGP